eukprot:1286787-Rhodomonas_salina.1
MVSGACHEAATTHCQGRPPLVLGFRLQGSGLRAQGSGLRAQGSGFGFRVQGLGLRAQGSGLRIWVEG